MKLAVISDTHDHKYNIIKAVSIMNERKVDALIHCGDYVAPFVKRWFDGLNNNIKENFLGVFGNNDGERIGLHKTAEGRISPSPAEFAVGEWKVLLAHEMPILEGVAAGGHYGLVVYGHTHLPDVQVKGETLLVNPGECGGWLKGRCTVALAHLDTLKAEIIDL